MAAPILVASLVGGLVSAAASMAGRIAIALGVGFVAYTGLQAGIDSLQAGVIANLLGLPARVTQVAHLLKVDVAISILFSAIAARLVLQGLTGGVLKRMVLK